MLPPTHTSSVFGTVTGQPHWLALGIPNIQVFGGLLLTTHSFRSRVVWGRVLRHHVPSLPRVSHTPPPRPPQPPHLSNNTDSWSFSNLFSIHSVLTISSSQPRTEQTKQHLILHGSRPYKLASSKVKIKVSFLLIEKGTLFKKNSFKFTKSITIRQIFCTMQVKVKAQERVLFCAIKKILYLSSLRACMHR